MPDTLLAQLDPGWRRVIEAELARPYMRELQAFLRVQARQGKVIYPPSAQWFKAFLLTPLDTVNVVIVGQDPYHGPGQAHGLSFSVPDGVPLPPSLRNIYKELYAGAAAPTSGDLSHWATQGVLLLNASLTVERGLAGSHAKKGWLEFTRRCLQAACAERSNLVFLAWGRFAHGVCEVVDGKRHRIIKTSHPSPLGATKSGRDFKAFLGSGCFLEANAQLQRWGKAPVRWAPQ